MLVRSDALSVGAFRDYWHGKHADIVRQMPHLHRYVQNHILRKIGADVGEPAFQVDGIPELWFRDEEAKAAAFQSHAAKALPADEKNFIKGITIFAVEETVLRPGDGAAKVLLLARGAAGQLCEKLSRTLPGLKRCVCNRILSSEHRPGVWHEPSPPDLIVELRFDSEGDAEAALASDAYQSLGASAVHRGAAIAVYLVDERTIV